MLNGVLVAQRTSIQKVSRPGLYARLVKRPLDLVLLLMMLPFVLPMIALLAVVIMTDGGPALYSQERIGRGGRIFRMWKLRSMTVNADAELAQLLEGDAAARTEWEETQKLRNDPRVTWIGRVIRISSLDELPQLWNVLVGDMSFVGPRPFLPEQMALYPGESYYKMRPGLTGYWQTSQRNESSFRERATYDNLYYSELSLLTDLRLLSRTVNVVLRGTGC